MAGGPALILTFLVAIWLAQRFSGRLQRLQMQVAAIAGGDFREIVPDDRQDEIQDLVTSVNRMAAQLREMQTAIGHTERTRLLAQLAGGLAHQLRNAVAGARMAVQLHQRRCTSDLRDESLAVALRQLSLTETQIRGLLSLGRSERREPALCNVRSLIDEVGSLLQPTCEHGGVTLDVDSATAGEPSVQVDVEGLRAAILNLALNAIEAAGRQGEVVLRAARDGRFATIDVRDSGAGPPAEIAEALFDPFVTSKPEGVGLGLVLARQVALEHGGTLAWFREGNRTVFRLTLPLAREEASIRTANSQSAAAGIRDNELAPFEATSEVRNSKFEITA
jgi:signal transduction histidine kinase